MKFLVIGEHYSSNLGDGVICEVVKSILHEAYPSSEIVISELSSRSGFSQSCEENNSNKKSLDTTSLMKKVIKKILFKNQFLKYKYINEKQKSISYICNICNKNYDIAVFAGGQLFLDYFSISITKHIEELLKRNIPIIFNACGMGAIKSQILLSKLIFGLKQSNVLSITSRDDVEMINKKLLMGSDKLATKTYDPALWASDVYGIKKEDSDTVGLGVIRLNPGFDKNLLNLFDKLIQDLNSRNIKWELFCNGAEHDFAYAISIANKLGYDESVVSERPKTPIELIKTISKYKSIISCRLHSHIIATSLDIPSIGLVWDDKLRFFFENIECADRYFDITEDHNKIINKLFEAEKKGYNKELIEMQKSISKNTLLDNTAQAIIKRG